MSIRQGAIEYFAGQAAVQAVFGNPARLRPRPKQRDPMPYAKVLILSDGPEDGTLNQAGSRYVAVLRFVVTAATYAAADAAAAAIWGVLGQTRLEAVGGSAWDGHDVEDAHWTGGGDLELTPFADGDQDDCQRYLDLEITYNPVAAS